MQEVNNNETITLSESKENRYGIHLKIKAGIWLSKCLGKINNSINNYNLKLRNYIKEISIVNNPNSFEDLTPTTYSEESKEYCKTIDWALHNDKIRNIAITGVYGAGKSSIIQSYREQHCEHKYLNISLASFNLEKKDDGEENCSDYRLNDIEKGILEQMFYKVKFKNIPNSRFKRIISVKTNTIISILLFILLVGTLATYLFKYDYFIEMREKVTSFIGINSFYEISKSMAFIFVVIVSFFMMVKIIKYLVNNYKISKIKIRDNEAEKKTIENETIFNKYMDEILYFFESTKYDVVIFEDLDRFDDIKIFTDLRHLNILINNCEQIGRKIVFIYAIKDDMFCNDFGKDDMESWKNRTKFFDFMIPIIPVVNSVNASDIFIKKLEKANAMEGLDKEFIRDIIFIINDMRILKNIYNEYIIYLKNLSKEKDTKIQVIHKKLFAMIVYKNLYPTDFANLQLDKGILFYLLLPSTLKKLRDEKSKKYVNKIQEIKNEISEIKKEKIDILTELRYIYVIKISSNNNMSGAIINGEFNNLYNIANNEDSFNIFFNERIEYTYHTYYSSGTGYLKNEDKQLKAEFASRKELLEQKNNESLKNLRNKINELNRLIDEVNVLPIDKLIDGVDDLNNKLLNGSKDTKMLSYLVYNGYIDDTYYKYTSYFYPGSLSYRDYNFLTKVILEDQLDYDAQIDNVREVVEEIKEVKFGTKYTLNYYILDFLLKNRNIESYRLKYDRFMVQLSNGDDDSIKFILKYIDRGIELGSFINCICRYWHNIWNYLYNEDNEFASNQLDKYIKIIVKYADMNDIEKINVNDKIIKYLSGMNNFLDVFNDSSYSKKVEDIISKYNIKFHCIEEKEYDYKEILDYIYTEQKYEINLNMIRVILCNYNVEKAIMDSLQSKNYSSIMESNCGELIEYIDNNINEYVEDVLLELECNIYESQEIIIDLLNNEDILLENKLKIIKKIEVRISNIDSVDVSLWQQLLSKNKIQIKWKNILLYYNEVEELDMVLVNYINTEEVYCELAKFEASYENIIDEEVYDDFNYKILICMDISDKSIKKIIDKLCNSYESIDLRNITKERAKLLVEANKLVLTNENVQELKKFQGDLHIILISKYLSEFIEKFDDFELNASDYDKILNLSISRENLLKIIELIDESLVKEDRNLATTSAVIILRGRSYSNEDVCMMLIQAKVNYELKLKLFDRILDNISEDDIATCLENIGGEFAKIATFRRSAHIEKNQLNNSIINKLEERKFKYISTIDRTTNGSEIKVNTRHYL